MTVRFKKIHSHYSERWLLKSETSQWNHRTPPKEEIRLPYKIALTTFLRRRSRFLHNSASGFENQTIKSQRNSRQEKRWHSIKHRCDNFHKTSFCVDASAACYNCGNFKNKKNKFVYPCNKVVAWALRKKYQLATEFEYFTYVMSDLVIFLRNHILHRLAIEVI